MGPADIILSVLALAFGTGLGGLLKSLADARSIKAKLPPEVENLNLTNMEIVVGGQATHIGHLYQDNATLRQENHVIETRYERLYHWAIDLVTRWHEHRKKEAPPLLPDAEEE